MFNGYHESPATSYNEFDLDRGKKNQSASKWPCGNGGNGGGGVQPPQNQDLWSAHKPPFIGLPHPVTAKCSCPGCFQLPENQNYSGDISWHRTWFSRPYPVSVNPPQDIVKIHGNHRWENPGLPTESYTEPGQYVQENGDKSLYYKPYSGFRHGDVYQSGVISSVKSCKVDLPKQDLPDRFEPNCDPYQRRRIEDANYFNNNVDSCRLQAGIPQYHLHSNKRTIFESFSKTVPSNPENRVPHTNSKENVYHSYIDPNDIGKINQMPESRLQSEENLNYPAEYHSLNTEFHVDKKFMNGMQPQYFPRNNFPDVIKRTNQNFMVNRKEFNKKAAVNPAKTHQVSQLPLHMNIPQSPSYGKYNPKDCVLSDKMPSIIGHKSSEVYKGRDEVQHNHILRQQIESDTSFMYQNKAYRRPDCFRRNTWNELTADQQGIPNFPDVANGLDPYMQQMEKMHYQMPIDKPQSANPQGNFTEAKISHLESIRFEELCKNKTSKISPLRLLRKKKLNHQKEAIQSTVVEVNNDTPPLDVRRFWATWADEEEENVPQTQMVVLDCHNIDPEQASLFNLCNTEPIRAVHLEGNFLGEQLDKESEQSRMIEFENSVDISAVDEIKKQKNPEQDVSLFAESKSAADDIQRQEEIAKTDSKQYEKGYVDNSLERELDDSGHDSETSVLLKKDNLDSDDNVTKNDMKEENVDVDEVATKQLAECTNDSKEAHDLPTSEYRKNKFLDFSNSFEINHNECMKPLELAANNFEIDEILKNLSGINFQGSDPNSPNEHKTDNKKQLTKPRKQCCKSSRTDELTLENISLTKPTIKFSIQKSHDLKISFKVLNKKYEGEDEPGEVNEDLGEDEEDEARKSRRRLITLKLKGLSEKGDDSRKFKGEDHVKKSRKLPKKKKRPHSPKTPILKIKKSRYMAAEGEEKGSELVSDEVCNDGGAHGDFQVHETVESAKIKLTFKRNKNSKEKKKVLLENDEAYKEEESAFVQSAEPEDDPIGINEHEEDEQGELGCDSPNNPVSSNTNPLDIAPEPDTTSEQNAFAEFNAEIDPDNMSILQENSNTINQSDQTSEVTEGKAEERTEDIVGESQSETLETEIGELDSKPVDSVPTEPTNDLIEDELCKLSGIKEKNYVDKTDSDMIKDESNGEVTNEVKQVEESELDLVNKLVNEEDETNEKTVAEIAVDNVTVIEENDIFENVSSNDATENESEQKELAACLKDSKSDIVDDAKAIDDTVEEISEEPAKMVNILEESGHGVEEPIDSSENNVMKEEDQLEEGELVDDVVPEIEVPVIEKEIVEESVNQISVLVDSVIPTDFDKDVVSNKIEFIDRKINRRWSCGDCKPERCCMRRSKSLNFKLTFSDGTSENEKTVPELDIPVCDVSSTNEKTETETDISVCDMSSINEKAETEVDIPVCDVSSTNEKTLSELNIPVCEMSLANEKAETEVDIPVCDMSSSTNEKTVSELDIPVCDIPLPLGDAPPENCINWSEYFQRKMEKEPSPPPPPTPSKQTNEDVVNDSTTEKQPEVLLDDLLKPEDQNIDLPNEEIEEKLPEFPEIDLTKQTPMSIYESEDLFDDSITDDMQDDKVSDDDKFRNIMQNCLDNAKKFLSKPKPLVAETSEDILNVTDFISNPVDNWPYLEEEVTSSPGKCDDETDLLRLDDAYIDETPKSRRVSLSEAEIKKKAVPNRRKTIDGVARWKSFHDSNEEVCRNKLFYKSSSWQPKVMLFRISKKLIESLPGRNKEVLKEVKKRNRFRNLYTKKNTVPVEITKDKRILVDKKVSSTGEKKSEEKVKPDRRKEERSKRKRDHDEIENKNQSRENWKKPEDKDKRAKRDSERRHWSCEVCGFSKSSERATHIQSHPFHCQSCHLAFKTEVNFVEHLTRKHKDIKNQHHCLLCELSFDHEKEYYRHLETREHKHLEAVEKNTINTLFTLLTGHPCPVLGPYETKPEWLPTQAGTVHFYHQATPLSLALQYLKLHDRSAGTLSPQ